MPSVAERNLRKSPQKLVSEWTLVAHLGEGQWSDCFLARPTGCHQEWPADYVVKQLKPAWRNDTMARRQLATEAKLGRELAHPNLVALLAADLNAATPYLVFPHVPAISLKSMLAQQQRLPLAFSLWLVRQAFNALSAIHEKGYRHGDMTTANMLVSANWHLTVIDLGLARPLTSPTNFHQQWLAGSVGYSAPEALNSPSAPGASADFYSLGVILYELITGRRPDQNAVGPHGRFIDLKQACPAVNTELARLVRELLAVDPAHRPKASALGSRLHRLEIFHVADREKSEISSPILQDQR
jgi:serine/threonine protein kinase